MVVKKIQKLKFKELVIWLFHKHCGKPTTFYSDKHSIFGSIKALCRLRRAMHELDIEIISANTPQAKGRIEHVIQTWHNHCTWRTGNILALD